MAVDWLNDDLTLKPGFETNLPAEIRDYAKDAKDLPGLIRRGKDTQADLHSRVRIPDDDAGKREVLKKHFQPLLDADAKKAKDEADAAARKQQETDAAAKADAATKQLEAAQGQVKTMLGGTEGKDFDKNMELCRRVVRGEQCPKGLLDLIAHNAGVEAAKVTDDHIKAALASDPFITGVVHQIATLTQDGRLGHGDGHANDKDKVPGYPKSPGLYKSRPDSDPEKQWFVKHGYNFETDQWEGRPV